MSKLPCIHCSVPTPEIHLHRGHCGECLSEAGELAPLDRAMLEAQAVTLCRLAGLRAVPSICDDPRCGSCVAQTPTPERVERNDKYGGRRRWSEEFCEQDSIDLERYFAADVSLKWDRSTFGSMCDHLAQLPTVSPQERAEFYRRTQPRAPDILETPFRFYDMEIGGRVVQVTVLPAQLPPEAWPSTTISASGSSRGGEKVDYDEDDMASYFDGRYRMRRVFRVLSRLTKAKYAVLEARYSPSQEQSSGELGQLAAVGLLTATAKKERERRAGTSRSGSGDGGEADRSGSNSSRDALLALTTSANSHTCTSEERKRAGARLSEIFRESKDLLASAEAAYAKAALAIGA